MNMALNVPWSGLAAGSCQGLPWPNHALNGDFFLSLNAAEFRREAEKHHSALLMAPVAEQRCCSSSTYTHTYIFQAILLLTPRYFPTDPLLSHFELAPP